MSDVTNSSSFSPRAGVQFDLNARTRVRSALTQQTEERSWANAIELEGQSVAFSEPVAVEDLFLVSGKPMLNNSRRVEFGIERVLDGQSSIEANFFFDTVFSRGVGLTDVEDLDDGITDMVANQQGESRGIRVVYSKRLGSVFSASAGYSAGQGQKLSESVLNDPTRAFENDFFQSVFGQLTTDLGGTSIRAIYRLSPEATVFAIDPFKGRLAVYDPGLSVYVTHALPTFGLPFRAQAMVDARNLFDVQTGLSSDEGTIRFNGHGRMVRGGIQVRF